MKIFWKYLSWHKIKISNFLRFKLSMHGNRLCLFFNIHAFFMGLSARLEYDHGSSTYKITDGVIKKFISPQTAKWSYWHGIAFRGDSLGRNYFLNELEFKAGDIVVDCGAHIGDLKIYFENLGSDVEYIGFEPSPFEFKCLQENVYPSKVHNVGLWEKKSELEFFQSSFNADSSFIKPKVFTHSFKVSVDCLSNIEKRKIRLLKIEAEGGEIEVLRGCKDIFQNIYYIAGDFGFERGVNEDNTFPDCINLLLANGFQAVKVVAPNGRNTALFKNSKI